MSNFSAPNLDGHARPTQFNASASTPHPLDAHLSNIPQPDYRRYNYPNHDSHLQNPYQRFDSRMESRKYDDHKKRHSRSHSRGSFSRYNDVEVLRPPPDYSLSGMNHSILDGIDIKELYQSTPKYDSHAYTSQPHAPQNYPPRPIYASQPIPPNSMHPSQKYPSQTYPQQPIHNSKLGDELRRPSTHNKYFRKRKREYDDSMRHSSAKRGHHLPSMSKMVQRTLTEEEFHQWMKDRQKIHPFPNDHHLLQNLACVKLDTFTAKERVLQADAPRMAYYSRKNKGEVITVNHWGQRKLLMSEIEFLTLYCEPGQKRTVIYAGAAPGTHTNYLASLFPDVSFVLVDPAKFLVTPTDSIMLRKEYMTDNVAKEYADRDDVLFISDIRVNETEEQLLLDNTNQMNWHIIMKPIASMLKYKCPYYVPSKVSKEEDKFYQYLDGDIYLPVWGRQSTTECRLIVPKDFKLKKYDIKQFEEQLFYFNCRTRVNYYPHDIEQEGLCHCFDCRSEVYILEQYLRKFQNVQDDEIKTKIETMVGRISLECSPHSGRNLLWIEPTWKDSTVDDDVKAYKIQLTEGQPIPSRLSHERDLIESDNQSAINI